MVDWQAVSLFHVTSVTSAPWIWFLLCCFLGGFVCVVCVLVCFFWGALDDVFFLTSSKGHDRNCLEQCGIGEKNPKDP